MDFGGSVLVLWRFSGGGETTPKAVLESRERRADVGISLMFVVLAVIVIAEASKDLVGHDEDKDLIELIAIYSPSTVVFFGLGVAKLHIGAAIRSPSLRKDGMCSLAGALMFLGEAASLLPPSLGTPPARSQVLGRPRLRDHGGADGHLVGRLLRRAPRLRGPRRQGPHLPRGGRELGNPLVVRGLLANGLRRPGQSPPRRRRRPAPQQRALGTVHPGGAE